ncbi:carbonate dehydratase [Psychrobium sp. 1_MG-2023]|uniref:carbonate dehydratase n=1 Tax=Psychrobium sp. 1_MG-2023 TaxID=3062624 RepID=UPI000C331C32|nr:carbonate dehydratase [Psychrobium sp. 1_MG-2023]MDP2561258.1 carbonate dehydratase [Psychrobium sp. 1_MG-2023]PKF55241.1 carbonate dehydratase [Alteromonadales bacterium alter-6D02]
MKFLPQLFANNKQWAHDTEQQEPGFFKALSEQQKPEYLWIGCADSRVPANQIVGLKPGELFVHRNIANTVVHTDLNCLSVIQYAVDVLKVKHIIVTGHYGCGGVIAAMSNGKFGLIDNWLRHIKDVEYKHKEQLRAIENIPLRQDRLIELNVIEQVMNVAQTSIVQGAWERGQELQLHSWIYSVKDGRLRDLNTCISSSEEAIPVYKAAIKSLAESDA